MSVNHFMRSFVIMAYGLSYAPSKLFLASGPWYLLVSPWLGFPKATEMRLAYCVVNGERAHGRIVSKKAACVYCAGCVYSPGAPVAAGSSFQHARRACRQPGWPA